MLLSDNKPFLTSQWSHQCSQIIICCPRGAIQTLLLTIAGRSSPALLPKLSMRLLNTTTYALKNFLGEDIPEYAILSHTWGEEEIVLQDLLAQTGDDSWKKKEILQKGIWLLFTGE